MTETSDMEALWKPQPPGFDPRRPAKSVSNPYFVGQTRIRPAAARPRSHFASRRSPVRFRLAPLTLILRSCRVSWTGALVGDLASAAVLMLLLSIAVHSRASTRGLPPLELAVATPDRWRPFWLEPAETLDESARLSARHALRYDESGRTETAEDERRAAKRTHGAAARARAQAEALGVTLEELGRRVEAEGE